MNLEKPNKMYLTYTHRTWSSESKERQKDNKNAIETLEKYQHEARSIAVTASVFVVLTLILCLCLYVKFSLFP